MKFNNLNAILCLALTFLVGTNEALTTTGKTIPTSTTTGKTIPTSTTTGKTIPGARVVTQATIAKNTPSKNTEVIFMYYDENRKTTLQVPASAKEVFGECTRSYRPYTGTTLLKSLNTQTPKAIPQKRDDIPKTIVSSSNSKLQARGYGYNDNYVCNLVGDCYSKYGIYSFPDDRNNADVICTAYIYEDKVTEIETSKVQKISNICKPTLTNVNSAKCSYATPTYSVEENDCKYMGKRQCIYTNKVVEVNSRGDGCNLGYEFGEYCIIKEEPTNPLDPFVELVDKKANYYLGILCPSSECQPIYYYNGDLYGTYNYIYDKDKNIIKTEKCVCNNPSKPVDMSTIQKFGGLLSDKCDAYKHFKDIIEGRNCIANDGIFFYKPKEYKCQETSYMCIKNSESVYEGDEEYCIERNGKNYCKCMYYNNSRRTMEYCHRIIEEENLIELDYVPEEYIQDSYLYTVTTTKTKTISETSTTTISKNDPSCPSTTKTLINEKKKECVEKNGLIFYYKEHKNDCDIDYVCYIVEPTENKNEVNKRSYDSNLSVCQVASNESQEKLITCKASINGFKAEELTVDKKYVYPSAMGVRLVTYYNSDFTSYNTRYQAFPPEITKAIARCTTTVASFSSAKQLIGYTRYVVCDESKDECYKQYHVATSSERIIPNLPYGSIVACTTYTPYATLDDDGGFGVVTQYVNRKTKTTSKIPPPVTTTTKTTSTISTIPTATTTTSIKLPPTEFIATPTTTTTTTTITTTTTKQPPSSFITTTTTDSNNTTTNVISTTCKRLTYTITVKEKVTVTEKETVTVTVEGNGSETPNPNQQCSQKWAQCGGQDYSGPTCCESGSTCHEYNKYYSQCI